MRIINIEHKRFWIWYFKLSDKYHSYFSSFNMKLINLDKYEDWEEEHKELAWLVHFSGQL
jgi:hypothetical protein